jgi:general secretion pathway protein A
MFEKHFGLRENPFPAGHQMRFLYPSREHQEARAHLRYGIENREPFVLITGEVGTGKTTALYDALAEWGAQVSVALITNSALTRSELLEEICLRFGVALPAEVSKPKMLALLERHLLGVRSRGEHAVLLLDEAQNLSTDLLEEIRLLSNVEAQGEKLMQIFLVAQPELEARLARPELRQLRQRITVHYRLNPLSPEETAGYIHHRISVAGGNAWTTFPPETCREIYRVTHGIPREINTIASQAMITSFSENASTVTVAHVQAASHEAEFNSVLAVSAPKLPSAADMAAALTAKAEPAPAAAEPQPVAPPAEQPAAPAAAPPPASAPPAPPLGSSPSPHAEAPPAWTPDAHEKPAERFEPVLREELDAWSAAASDLLRARQRAREGAVEPPVRAQDYVAPPAPPAPLPFPVPAHAAATPASHTEEPEAPALPHRLRDKLEAELAEEERHGTALPWMIGVAAIAVVVMGVVLAQRFGAIDLPVLRGLAGKPAAHEPSADRATNASVPATDSATTTATLQHSPATGVPAGNEPVTSTTTAPVTAATTPPAP